MSIGACFAQRLLRKAAVYTYLDIGPICPDVICGGMEIE